VIYRAGAFSWAGRIFFYSLIAGTFLAAMPKLVLADTSVTLAWAPEANTNIVGYNVYYGGASGVYTNMVSAANTTNIVISGLLPGATYYFAAKAHDGSGAESPFSNEASYSIPLDTIPAPVPNQPPILSPINNFYLTENAAEQKVSLTVISPDTANIISHTSKKKPTIKITAVSGNHKLLETPTIRYSSPESAGIMIFKPKHNAIGTTTIIVTVKDGSKDGNVIMQKTFTVTILPKNQPMPATLTPTTHLDGEFALTITGSNGSEYIVQASANMVDWIPVQTNTAPFIFTDTHAGEFSQRFYRSVCVTQN
jgi:hypothetical protein